MRNFNPRSPCGERLIDGVEYTAAPEFQSTLPVWGATCRMRIDGHTFEISIHAPRVGSDGDGEPCCSECKAISIHAPRVGSDLRPGNTGKQDRYFNPRSPCGERRQLEDQIRRHQRDFNPRSPCGERRWCSCLPMRYADFNPRSPCGERRLREIVQADRLIDFNPRSPCGERRKSGCVY